MRRSRRVPRQVEGLDRERADAHRLAIRELMRDVCRLLVHHAAKPRHQPLRRGHTLHERAPGGEREDLRLRKEPARPEMVAASVREEDGPLGAPCFRPQPPGALTRSKTPWPPPPPASPASGHGLLRCAFALAQVPVARHAGGVDDERVAGVPLPRRVDGDLDVVGPRESAPGQVRWRAAPRRRGRDTLRTRRGRARRACAA